MDHSTTAGRSAAKSQVKTTISSLDATPSRELTFEDVIAQARALAAGADENGRKQIIDGLRDLAVSLEDTQESAQRLLYSQYPLMALRLGCDLKLFNILKDAARPLSTVELATKTGVAPKLMGRLLRYMASMRIIEETGPDTFTANNVTGTFTIPGFQGAVYHYFDYVGPGIKHFPDFLKERGYKDVESAIDSPVPRAWSSDLPVFLHFQTQPELFEHFNRYMVVQRMGMPTWLHVYPYETAAEGLAPDRPFFVDVGGGVGHQSIALRKALPHLPNRFILQDIPATLEHRIKHPGVEVQVQDFFTPQQTKGAKLYYMRNIIHDYPDDRALEILKHTKDALSTDSVILIDDMCLKKSDVHWQAAQLDMTMMLACSAIERTEAQWRELIPKAGLKIRNIYRYTESLGDCIIECVST